jgi:hypothetical protein
VTIVLQDPERPGGKPVIIVAIQDNGGIIADPRPPQKLFQVCFAQWCPHHLVLQFFLPVEANCPWNVPLIVGIRIDINLDQANLWIV